MAMTRGRDVMGEPHPAWVFTSRCLNIVLLGRWEMVCARAHRRRMIAVEAAIDRAWVALGGAPAHCRRTHEWESRR